MLISESRPRPRTARARLATSLSISLSISLPLAAGAVLATPGAARAGSVRHPAVVSADPVRRTPHVLNGIVNAFALVGGKVVVGGEFDAVRDAGDPHVLKRHNIFAFDLATGKIDRHFAPELDGPVYALAAGAGSTVYAGGAFHTVNGWQGARLTRLSLRDGSAVYGFSPWVSGGIVSALVRQGDLLYVGGGFSRVGGRAHPALVRLDARSGEVDPRFHVTPGESRSGQVKVYAMAASRDRLLIDGSFMTLDGRPRAQLGLIDISRPEARVAAWRSDAYRPACKDVFPSYVRGLDFSPDGKYFVVVTTGGPKHHDRLCDSAARFETYSKARRIKPTWVNRTGGDSLYAVSVSGAAVYVGGHQRWLNNPEGSDSAGPGAVSRPGIGALDPVTGRALAWNPTRTRGVGVKAFLAVRQGLIVGSDTTRLGHEYHARVGMFPIGH